MNGENKMASGISILGSGSLGNSILIHSAENGILVDAGFSRKEILNRLNLLQIEPSIIKALLITHEHEDHVRGSRILADHLGVPTYLTDETFRYLRASNKIGAKKILFDPGSPFQIEGFNIEPFTVQHDALQTVGFIIGTGNHRIGIATDLGHLNRLAIERLRGCDAIILECNYDTGMLRDSERPFFIKKRIMGRHGHLNNEDAISAFDEIITEKTRFIFLAHISLECNSYELVRNLALEKLKIMQRTDILLNIIEQSKPLDTVWI